MNTKETDSSLQESKIQSEKVFSGTLLQVYKDQVSLPDNRTSIREWIDHPGASAVLPIFTSGEVQLIKQFRYPLQKTFLEVPAGKIDRGEEPLQTVKRELEEETGITGAHWVPLGVIHPCIGFCNEIIYLFATWGLEVSNKMTDEDEFLTQVRIPFQQAVDDALNGEITDAKSVANILRAAQWWMKNEPFQIQVRI